MWLFYFNMAFMVFSAVFLYLILKGKNFSLVYILLNVGLMAFLSMFRSISVGNDTNDYVNLFYNISYGNDLALYSSRFEIGYLYLNKFLNYFSSNHQILLMTTSAYIFFVIGRFIYKYSKSPWLSLILFYSLRFFDISLSGIRQMLAVATVILAYEFLIEKKIVKYIVAMIIAISFHNAAILFLISYPMKKYKLTSKMILIVTFITGLLFLLLDPILSRILLYFPKYYSYVYNSKGEGEVKLATLLGFIVFLLIFIACELLNRKKSYYDNDLSLKINRNIKTQEDELQSLFLLISCAVLFIALQVDIIARFKNIFGMFAIIYFPNSITKLTDKYVKLSFVIIVVILFLAHITAIHLFRPEWQSTYPYSFFWND
ncbi:MAG: hypothetical protein CVU98_01140 [Firmicutes bacterium HGW-Firmicutes-3]|jgi:hypothetical protein|nr:MAG: hypothetical protein CVU98_01140 [Firmicutes bacterium HGW-Firmicutes-3]